MHRTAQSGGRAGFRASCGSGERLLFPQGGAGFASLFATVFTYDLTPELSGVFRKDGGIKGSWLKFPSKN